MALRPENCRVEGVTLRNPTFWTSHIIGAKDFAFRDLRVLSNHRINGDGLNFDSSTDGLIDNCSMANGDDSHCLKNEGVSGILAPNERITMRNSIACDWGKSVKFGWNFTKAIDCTYENNVLLADFSIAIGRKYPQGVSPRVAEVRNLTLRNMRIAGALDIYLAGKLLESYSMDGVTIEDSEASRIKFSNTSHLTFRRFTLAGQKVTALEQVQPFLTDCTQVTVE
jgi:polygalacturonase